MTVLAIIVIILTFAIWILSHRYFRFIYFGNMGNAIIGELIECFIISFILVAVVAGIGKVFLSSIGAVILFLFKIVLSLVIICAIVAVFTRLLRKRHRKDVQSIEDTSLENKQEEL